MIAAVTQKLRSRDMETELVLKSISAIAVALPDYVRVLKITEKYRYCFCPSNVRTFNRVARMTTSNDVVWLQLP